MARVTLKAAMINAIVRQHKAGSDEAKIAEALGTKLHVVHEVLTAKELLARPVPAARKARADAVLAYWLGKTSTIQVARYLKSATSEVTAEESTGSIGMFGLATLPFRTSAPAESTSTTPDPQIDSVELGTRVAEELSPVA